LRLLIVTQYFWPENFRVNDLASDLIERGHKVTVLTGVPNYPEGKIFKDFSASPKNYSYYKGVEIARVPIVARGVGNFRLLLNYISYALSASIFGLWKIRGKEFDAIFVYEPSPITVGFPAIAIKYLKKAPLVFWVLDLWPDTLKAVGVVKSNWLLKVVGLAVAYIYKRCDLILAQSKSFIPQIKKYTSSKTPIKYFPSWPDLILTTKSNFKAPEIKNSDRFFNIIFAGNIGEAQDFESILLAANILKENQRVRWYIFGNGRRSKWLEEQVNLLGLEKVFFMMGAYPIERMPSFFSHANALLVSLRDRPIFSMTIPAKVQAYLASGKPIIAMLNGEGARVLLQSKAALVVRSGDYKSLAQAVVEMSRMDSNFLIEMGKNGPAFCDREFNRETLISKLERWLESVRIKNKIN
jgi:colanic acid biosynthesis glycosyl transferase WcaI